MGQTDSQKMIKLVADSRKRGKSGADGENACSCSTSMRGSKFKERAATSAADRIVLHDSDQDEKVKILK